jgi:anti-sigma factor RsiW
MTRNPFAHLDDEELAHLADGVLTPEDLRDIDAHLSSCSECQEAVNEALRGLAILARASEPPADMEQHARARRWSIAHDRSAIAPDEDEDIAEVGGRGLDEESEPQTPPDTKKGPEPDG